MPTFPAHEPFGSYEIADGVDVVGIPAEVGTLTALRAAPAEAAPDRPSVLILPGFTGSKEDFRDFAPMLAAAGWDIWVYSQRGQADSAAPDGTGNYRPDAFAADAVEVAELISPGRPVHLLGHSLGGVIAQQAAIRSPETWASVTLLCSGPHGWPGRHDDTYDVVAAHGSEAVWQMNNPTLADVPESALGADDVFWRERFRATADDNLMAGARLLRDHRDRTDELLATGLTFHVAHGEFDTAWPIDWQRDMADRLGGRYSVLAGGMHSPQFEAPEETLAALTDFWNSTPGRTAPSAE